MNHYTIAGMPTSADTSVLVPEFHAKYSNTDTGFTKYRFSKTK